MFERSWKSRYTTFTHRMKVANKRMQSDAAKAALLI